MGRREASVAVVAAAAVAATWSLLKRRRRAARLAGHAKVVLLPPDEATAEGRAGARVLRVSGSVEAVSIARSDLVPMTKTFEPAATSVGDFRGRFRYASTLDGIDDDDPPVKGVY